MGEVTLGAPWYGFNYKPIHGGIAQSGTKSINNLNFKMSEDDDGITPEAWFTFINNVINALGFNFEQAKINENRLYERA